MISVLNFKEKLKKNFYIKDIIGYDKNFQFSYLMSKIIFNNRIENNKKNLLYYNYDLYMINLLKAIFIKKLIKNLLLRSFIGKLYLNNFKYNIMNLINLKRIMGYLY